MLNSVRFLTELYLWRPDSTRARTHTTTTRVAQA